MGLRLFAFSLVCFGICSLSAELVIEAQTPAQNPSVVCSAPHLIEKVIVNGYAFESFESKDSDESGGCLKVVRGGKVIFQRTIDSWAPYTLGQKAESEHNIEAIPNGADITGRGYPDMVISLYTGGAHCCTMHYVFQLEPEFKLLATLNAADSDLAHFADLDQNHHYYYMAEDWTFAYWPSSFAGSPFAPVVLKFVDDGKGGGSYHLALDKMKKPVPTAAELREKLIEIHNILSADSTFMDGTLWTTEMQFIYAGHADLTRNFLDEAWPSSKPGKRKWTNDFCAILKTSPYWPDLKDNLKKPKSICVEGMLAKSQE